MYQTGVANGHYDLLDQLRRFIAGYGVAAAPVFAGTGNGTLGAVDTYPATLTETWTVACTDATTPGAEVWSVTGSVSGVQAAATTGVAYSNTWVAFTITAGGINFAVSDQFTISLTQGQLSAAGQAWLELRWDTSTDDHELILQGAGLSGTEAIYIGFKTYQSITSDWYNMKVDAFTGYAAGNTFETQPGNSGQRAVPLYNQPIAYWFRASGQGIQVVAKVENLYMPFSAGYFFPWATPTEFPYPLLLAAPLGSATTTRYSDTTLVMPWVGDRAGLVLRGIDGVWRQPKTHPWSARYWNGSFTDLRDTNGSYVLDPVEVWDITPNRYGRIDGIYAVSGFGVVAEDTLTVAGITYVLFHNLYRSGFQDYFALRLD